MNRAVLEFDLTDEYERECFEASYQGPRWRSTVRQLDEALRSKIKYASDDDSADYLRGMQVARELLHELVEGEELTL